MSASCGSEDDDFGVIDINGEMTINGKNIMLVTPYTMINRSGERKASGLNYLCTKAKNTLRLMKNLSS